MSSRLFPCGTSHEIDDNFDFGIESRADAVWDRSGTFTVDSALRLPWKH